MMLKIIEAFIQLTRDDCVVTKEARRIEPDCKIARLKIGEETTTHLVSTNDNADKLYTALQKKAISVSRVGKNSIWVEGKSCSGCHAISESGAITLSSRAVNDNTVIYRVLVKSKGSLEKITKDLKAKGFNPVVTLHEMPKELTAREREIIYEVYAHGFFDQMRKASLTEIAKNLGISTATLSESLRRTLRKIVRGFLEDSLVEEMETT